MKTGTWCVYKHTAPNSKVYIGITSKDPVRRWGVQGQGYKNNKHFWSAIQKHGWNNFTHEILIAGLSQEEACAKEIELINETKSYDHQFGYNVALGGQGNTMTEETKAKLRGRLKEVFSADEYRTAMRERSKAMWSNEEWRKQHTGENHPMYGHHHTDESKQKISESRKELFASLKEKGLPVPGTGHKHTEEAKAKMSAARKGTHWNYTLTEEQRKRRSYAKLGPRNPNYQKPMDPELKERLISLHSIPVVQIINGNERRVFTSAAEAERITGVCQSNITRVCKRQRSSAGGFKWEYAPVR